MDDFLIVIITIVLLLLLVSAFLIPFLVSYFSDLNEIRQKYLDEKRLEQTYSWYEYYKKEVSKSKYDKFRKK